MAKKPVVNKDTCIGCGACCAVCPNVFEMGDDGKSHVKKTDYDKDKEAIDEAIAVCPVDAISWEE